MEKASVVMPAYNEEKNIGKVISDIRKSGNYEIIVVDDGSKDNTSEIAKRHGCTCIRLAKNMGKGYACMIGAKIATNENIVFIDSDNQHDAGDIPSLVRELAHSDLVLGTRSFDEIPIQRQWSNKFARNVVSRAAKRNFSDALCGFRAIKRSKFLELGLEKNRYEFESEMLLKASRKGLRIKEVPVSVRYGLGSSMPAAQSAKVTAYILTQLVVN